ncbi:hypothetical protein K7W42_06110 [Deinococcus sp. HMF7604]|uniref:hypothetical protein n=1 Tax=Deinococcus betulae TaxID=2873312 RepID=UPI001CCF38F4|nr:hypothetical protein [Deinococcus betulae]MBZ9750433.1 hypothetical protein [Deinococcus betulae]
MPTRCQTTCLLVLGLFSALTLGYGQVSPSRLQGWTPRLARKACISLATLAVRRADIRQVVFTQPARFREGSWTLTGVLQLQYAPSGLTRAPFICQFTPGADLFEVVLVSLILGA